MSLQAHSIQKHKCDIVAGALHLQFAIDVENSSLLKSQICKTVVSSAGQATTDFSIWSAGSFSLPHALN